MRDLFVNPLRNSTEYRKIMECLLRKETPLCISGVVPGQRSNMIYSLYKDSKRPMVIMVHSDLEAKTLYDDMKFYLEEEVLLLKGEEIFFYSVEARDRKEEAKRIEALGELSKKREFLLIITAEAFMQKYLPKEHFLESFKEVEVGTVLDQKEFSDFLVSVGYQRETKVEGIGQFSIRGGITDVFPPGEECPLRIEFWGDEVDSIRVFDPINQKSLENLKEATISPARELVYPKDLKDAVGKIEKEMGTKVDEDILKEVEFIKSSIYFDGIEKYIDYMYKGENTIFSYIPDNAVVTMIEPDRVREKAKNYFEEFKENYIANRERGLALKGQGNLLFDWSQAMAMIEDRFILGFSYLGKSKRALNPKVNLDFEGREISGTQGKIKLLAEELKYLKSQNHQVVLIPGSLDRAKKLQDSLWNEEIETILLEDASKSILPGQIALVPGNISEGFQYPSLKYTVFSDKEIFGIHKQSSKKRKFKKGKKIESFLELEVGDYIVHENHGIGKFTGIEQLKVDGTRRDFIKIVYSGGDSLYVPTSQLDKVQKYVGNNHDNVKLNRLGTQEWAKAKQKAQKAVEEMAEELLQLYASREKAVGYGFSEDTMWQKEFEEKFPYDETEDQLKSIEETKKDMESKRVMDRLICGDVGYGKTEVAIRAVFKAVMDSKQVAFLVPTTILAQQHYRTFSKRFDGYPIRVEVLSRFKTPKEKKKILEDAQKGLVDVLIGTHSIIADSLEFKDLGLVVIDEEQRFGVKHKEKLKKFKNAVDVITLSATPIPRTLHMSLSGIRDMSLIEDPPEERHPVLTYVTEAKEGIIADAIEREISRGGQVFFVYNRVNDIERMVSLVSRLVPKAKVAMGHGQMSSRQLEKVMMGFLEKEYDVLVSTTIIETGMDISNANTIIVYDADKMGLSQLYQLRGRVGRSSRQGYGYFMYEKDKSLSEVAEKRLKAIKEFTEFGSGFKIAMRDLEIRGAGNILGPQQHGHMATIGYDLYFKMLEETMKKLKGEIVIPKTDTEIELMVNAYIPEDYIEDEIEKIDVYKKIASIQNREDRIEIESELDDRFSEMPTPVKTLVLISYIKSLGQKLNITKIKSDGKMILFDYFDPKLSKSGTIKKDFKEKNHYKLVEEIAGFLEKML